jgi:3'(2'), 5'-bisphosphate nucleotidase
MISRSHLEEGTSRFLDALPVRQRIASGSSLKFCRIAEGRADVYPRFGPTSEWDIAAGHAIVAAAGGSVTKTDGGPLIYGQVAERFRVPDFVALGDPSAVADGLTQGPPE